MSWYHVRALFSRESIKSRRPCAERKGPKVPGTLKPTNERTMWRVTRDSKIRIKAKNKRTREGNATEKIRRRRGASARPSRVSSARGASRGAAGRTTKPPTTATLGLDSRRLPSALTGFLVRVSCDERSRRRQTVPTRDTPLRARQTVSVWNSIQTAGRPVVSVKPQ